jgi:hypothetical protein
VIMLMAESFGGKPGSEVLAEKLERRGVAVCKVYNNTNLAETLHAFANLHKGLETRSWQPIPLPPSI